MLAALRQYEKSRAGQILSQAAVTLVPDPITGVLTLPREADEKYPVLAEAADRLDLKLDDMSPAARARLMEYLSRELHNLILESTTTAELRDRLGAKGSLRPDQYRVRTSKALRLKAATLGVRPRDIQTAVKEADAFQHFFAEDTNAPEAEGLSLFVKHVGEPASPSFHWILVVAHRVGKTVEARMAMILFRDDLPEDFEIVYPLNLLEGFCEVFGNPISVGRFEDRKFVLYERFRIEGDDPAVEVARWIESSPPHDSVIHLSFRAVKDPKAIDVAMAFHIDLSRYHEALRRHGIDI